MYEAALIKGMHLDRPSRPRSRPETGGRKPKMTADLINKAQRVYDSRQFTMASSERPLDAHSDKRLQLKGCTRGPRFD
jgi:hypothetical protein